MLSNKKYLLFSYSHRLYKFIIAYSGEFFNIKNAFRPSEKLPYFFTIHFYLLLSKKSVHAELVKSEEWKVKK